MVTQVLDGGEPIPGHPLRVSASYESEPYNLQRAIGTNYELGRLIGRGGYAEVFAVRDLKLKRELAVKVLRPDLVVTSNLLARFRREAEAVAALQHSHIVPVIDIGESRGICFILMPLVQGESLKAVLTREGPLPVEEVRRVLLEAASALAATHEAGVVHRDIKPENIMLEGRGRNVRLMDFGIAKAMDSGDRDLTGTGVVVGTPQYMSPEQATGDISVDHRTDQYSLAIAGYQMLSGRVPFDGETARAIITSQILEQPPRLDKLVPGLPASLVATLHRAMEKDPARRFANIDDFAAAIRGEIEPLAGMPPDKRLTQRRRRRVALAGGLTGLVVLSALATAAAMRAGTGKKESLAPPIDSAPALAQLAARGESTNSFVPPPPAAAKPDPKKTVEDDRGAGETAVADQRSTATTEIVPVRSAPFDTSPPVVPPKPASCETAFRESNFELALTQCRTEADTGSMSANRFMARIYSEGLGSTPVDHAKAIPFMVAAAKAGDMGITLELANRYAAGELGVAKDPTTATKYYRTVAEAGVTSVFPILAARLKEGVGLPVDEVAAAKWFERAAEHGHVASQLEMGNRYATGNGVKSDKATAHQWYERAASSGNAEAKYQVALDFLRGSGVAKSDSVGLKWLSEAASLGHTKAQQELAKRSR